MNIQGSTSVTQSSHTVNETAAAKMVGPNASDEKCFEKATKFVSDIFSESGKQTSANFDTAAELYTMARDARMKELDLPLNGKLSPEQAKVAKSDPMLNQYEQKINWAEKCSAQADGGVLSDFEAFEAFRDDLAIGAKFWATYSQDPSLSADQRQEAQLKASEFDEKLAFVQERWGEIRRNVFSG